MPCSVCGDPKHNRLTCTESRRIPLPFKTGLRKELLRTKKVRKTRTRTTAPRGEREG